MKPESVLSIEKELGIELRPLEEGEISDWTNTRRYELDGDGRLIGLHLRIRGLHSLDFLKHYTSISCLVIVSTPLADWSFLKELKQLTSLNLQDNQIRDLSFVEGLTQLTSLNLSANKIEDASYLRDITRLTSLSLYDNQISNWSFLLGLSELRSLNLGVNHIQNPWFLKGLKKLTSLWIGYNQISDWSFLQTMNEVSSLSLRASEIHDASFLKNMENLSSLDIGGNEISDWSFLKTLNKLESLDISSNGIQDATFLERMMQLRSLDLHCNKISDCSFLIGMDQLTWLDLSDNQIQDASFLEGKNQLTTLYLQSNQIQNASLLSGLNQLTALNLSDNKIQEWSFLTSLKTLTFLSLRNANVSDLSILKDMDELTTLDLHNNRIHDASFLKEFHQLLTLDLSQNQIRDVSFLKEMNQLVTLNLSDNQIEDISSLSEKHQLSMLFLSFNDIVDVSILRGLNQLSRLDLLKNRIDDASSVVAMNQLTSLNLAYNRMQDASFLKDMNTLTELYIDGNPLTTPPLEIATQGLEAIRQWFAAREQGEKNLNEVKVILVGEGGAGKTTLRKRLMGQEYNPNENMTDGIDIQDFEFECGPDKVLVHFWDFGGQEIMHATHQLFLSHRSLYILVLDARSEQDADQWLKRIEMSGGNSPVLIVLSKIDQNPSFEVNCKDLRSKYPQIQEFFRVDSTKQNHPGIADLRSILPEYLMKADAAGTPWPISWFNVKNAIASASQPYIERSEFARICRREGVDNAQAQSILMQYLHDLGLALHFEVTDLKHLQILNPHWVTQAVYRIINDESVRNQRGLFSGKSLETILAARDADVLKYPLEIHAYLVRLMIEFELCYNLKDDEFLIPSLLGVEEPTFEFDQKNVVRFAYHYPYLPTSIMSSFIVRRHSEIEGELKWRTGVVLKAEKARAVVRSHKSERKISIDVSGNHRREFCAIIRDEFQKIHRGFNKLQVEEKVPYYRNGVHIHDFDYEDLRFHEDEKVKKILVGKLLESFEVKDLLDGIEPKAKRQRAPSTVQRGDKVPAQTFDLSKASNFQLFIGDKNSGNNLFNNEQLNYVVAKSISESISIANHASTTSDEVVSLLKQLAEEVSKLVQHQSPEKAKQAAESLAEITRQATSDNPNKQLFKSSKKFLWDLAIETGSSILADLLKRSILPE